MRNRQRKLNRPPTKLAVMAIPNARPASPRLAIGLPSSAVAEADGVPGMFSRMAEKLPPRTYGEREEMIFLGKEIHEQKDYSEKIAEEIDGEVANFIKNAEKTAEKVIKDNKDKMKEVVELLIKKEIIEKEEFNNIFKK